MFKLLCLSLIIILGAATTSTVRSYINNLGLGYAKGFWRCGILLCQESTTACRILLKTDAVNRQLLTFKNACIDSEDMEILYTFRNVTLDESQDVDIDIQSRVGVANWTSTQIGAKQLNVQAIIAPEYWTEFKRQLITNLTNWTQ